MRSEAGFGWRVTLWWSLGASRENDGVSDFLHSQGFVCPHLREILLRHLKRMPFTQGPSAFFHPHLEDPSRGRRSTMKEQRTSCEGQQAMILRNSRIIMGPFFFLSLLTKGGKWENTKKSQKAPKPLIRVAAVFSCRNVGARDRSARILRYRSTNGKPDSNFDNSVKIELIFK
jgi:hypothetical protein